MLRCRSPYCGLSSPPTVPRTGMPSPLTFMRAYGLVTPRRETCTVWPSKCVIDALKPSKLSLREIRRSVVRSEPSRTKRSSGRTWSFTLMSPGIIPGFCSPARANVVASSPSAEPGSTSNTFSWVTSLHRSSDSTSCCCCTIKPSASCTLTFFTSLGQSLQPVHTLPLASQLDVPFLQPLHTMRRFTVIDRFTPLYASVSETSTDVSASSVRWMLPSSFFFALTAPSKPCIS
mmetsp:Transcript_25319/g.62761  ORF Transcript_25319/g.62761 Transcript_25319/m.62761 type:complete len:232 (-) Transcript_25319:148-843(-)